ncbi:MAG TPA: HD domain-containing protein [Dinghuibacter sp.]|uniref:HD domain-containing protein n=1 Tax=Dinghuibacter sp. TaxID=2024697 RepID=UPI002C3F9855|nr:HD domain-containing protein [Dinghuibacter sp.]HTJ14582.1 HD domain-containing protein [Dinghuibacter sp.]
MRKIINDPVYGFITIDHPLIFSILNHPWFQRLRRIQQMALASFVYPGAVHTRFLHSLGAYHLMSSALSELRAKGVDISPEEELAAKAGILLHDIGHGPFSHALEHVLVEDCSHESISRLIMKRLNEEFNGSLDLTILIFNGQYPKRFLHQLISGQLDVDRMDYLTRDSFFTGVSEGVIGYDRILKMLTVHDGDLMVEEKGIYSIEKFLVARRLMYWQVYLHKTVLSAEQMLVRILMRAKELVMDGRLSPDGSPLYHFLEGPAEIDLDRFCRLDDSDVEGLLKRWTRHEDTVLSTLSSWLIDRRLLKIRLGNLPTPAGPLEETRRTVARNLGIGEREACYFVFDGTATNRTYDDRDEKIRVLFKNGEVRDISQVDNALIHQTLASPVKKFYFCFPRS